MMEMCSLVSGEVLVSVQKNEVRDLDALKRAVASHMHVTRLRVKLAGCLGDELRENDMLPEVMVQPGNIL